MENSDSGKNVLEGNNILINGSFEVNVDTRSELKFERGLLHFHKITVF